MATVQVRNLSESAYATFRRRAEESGRSLQEYLRVFLEEQATQETTDEAIRRVRDLRRQAPPRRRITREEIVAIQREVRGG
ncbi:FitA-like ribbon-helix-helix domain-containing protein [Brevibacterium litoralis]|uniref:FitA-like ribbon-helix-helix domain-containing protein n=1 Tax=Brevibacterium litoralis TaxID=3138935 RepID=UPI0032ECCDD1